MPVIKARNIAWCRLRAPDLDAMQKFLTDFGLVLAERTDDKLYMRGTGSRPFIHVTELGEPGFIGFAYEALSAEDLEKVAGLPGASAIEDVDGPGGGKRVRLKEPNGYQIEVVHGMAETECIECDPPMRRSFDPYAKRGPRSGAPAGSRCVRNADRRGNLGLVQRNAGLHQKPTSCASRIQTG